MYRTWFAIGLAGLLGGVAVVSLFVGFGSPVFLVVAAASAGGALLAYRYARERMFRSVYAGIGTPDGGAAHSRDDPTTGGAGAGEEATARASYSDTRRERGEDRDRDRDWAAQATDGGETTADYDEWTWADSAPDDPFWSDDTGDWEDPWAWEATDPEEAGADGWWETRETDAEGGSHRRSGWTREERDGGADEGRGGGQRRGPTPPGEGENRPTVAEAYGTLGLEPGADLEAVREAYRERVKETHPDLGGDPEAFIRVREAYERLRERIDGRRQ